MTLPRTLSRTLIERMADMIVVSFEWFMPTD